MLPVYEVHGKFAFHWKVLLSEFLLVATLFQFSGLESATLWGIALHNRVTRKPLPQLDFNRSPGTASHSKPCEDIL